MLKKEIYYALSTKKKTVIRHVIKTKENCKEINFYITEESENSPFYLMVNNKSSDSA